MLLGNKIRNARVAKGITQSELASDRITRNMISAIENGKASPSLATLEYLADALSVPLSYLVSDDENPVYFEKREKIERIKKLYSTARFSECIYAILKLQERDDELSYILASASERLGEKELFSGALSSAKKHLEMALSYAEETIYDTRAIRCSAFLYLSVCRNVYSPLLEFDNAKFEELYNDAVDIEFYKYLTADITYPFRSQNYKKHLDAKQLIKERLYSEALKLLLDIEAERKEYRFNAYFVFSLFGDIELCYKQLYDFENAYRYSSKRLSLIESFDS